MDAHRFDRLIQTLSSSTSRRQAVRGLLLGVVALGRGGDAATAGPGCTDVGRRCRKAVECCSNVCKGKKGKKRCRAHDTGGCRAGQTATKCGGSDVACTTSSGAAGRCVTTTGNAPYCAGGGDCRPCKKDADCHALCGPRAACITCSEGCANTGTECAGPDGVVCPL